MSETFLNGRVMLHCGDCLEVMAGLAENSVDACVCDPPYHLTSIVKRFGADDAASVKISKKWEAAGNTHGGGNSPYVRSSTGFMGKTWDGGDIAFRPEVWREVWRVLKPGAHLLAFGGTRTYHRMACAIEDAGFEIRDTIMWVYGSGFPKSHDVSKGIDRAAGLEREFVRISEASRANAKNHNIVARGVFSGDAKITAPATAASRQWEGWGTALKPACEPIVLARKLLSEKTVAANVLKWGTGAINVDGCRVGLEGGTKGCDAGPSNGILGDGLNGSFGKPVAGLGRWPANLIHDGSEEVLAGFPETNGQQGLVKGTEPSECHSSVYSGPHKREGIEYTPRNDSGSAARFFYTAKADSDDRLGSKHPTVKPIDLMQYLVRLVTPKGGTVLDPFAGTGTIGEAAWREGMNAVLIEREAEYQADIRRRMALCLSGPDERSREAAKERMKDKPMDHGPLFSGQMDWDTMWSRPFDYPERI